MNKLKFIYSNRTKIILIVIRVILTLYIGSLLTNIIYKNSLYEGDYWIAILAWMTQCIMMEKLNNCRLKILHKPLTKSNLTDYNNKYK